MALLDALKAEVAEEKNAQQSAITLINGIAEQLKQLLANSGNTVDPAELQAVVDELTASRAALAAAVVANTTSV